MPDPRRLYRLLLRLYPARFREEYGAPLERQFSDEYREAEGGGAKIRFWGRALADLATSIPAERARELRQDVAFAARVYRRRAFTTTLALAALALAIGATTGVFSVVNGLLLRSLPFRQPERVVKIRRGPAGPAAGAVPFYAWRDHCDYLEDAGTYVPGELNLTLSGRAVQVKAAETSDNFFRLLGAEPEFGRGFVKGEDAPGRGRVAVIGYGLWQQLYGGDPRALGSVIRINGAPFTIVGVARPGFDYPSKAAVWTPTAFDIEYIPKANVIFWETVGRLRAGLSLPQATRMMQTEIKRLHPNRLKDPADTASLIPLRDELAGPVRKASLVLLGMVGFVLLIACANVAQLLLARISERQHEMVIRAALGASRARLVQQLVTEAMLLTVAAAAAGMAVAHWASRLAAVAQPVQTSAQDYTVLDWRVLAFAAGLALLTGLIFGLLPAGLVARFENTEHLIHSQPGAHGSGIRRLRSGLVFLQAGFTIVLLAGCLGMTRSFWNLLGTDLGYSTDHVVSVSVSLAGTRHDSDPHRSAYYDEVLGRLRAAPGVESAAAVDHLPLMSNMFSGFRFRLDVSREQKLAVLIGASPGYFQTIGTAVLQGREFTEADRRSGEPVVIINEALAREVGDGASLVGRKLLSYGKRQYTVVGVVRTARTAGPAYEGSEQVFLPLEQWAVGNLTFVARVHGNPVPYVALCRDIVRRVDPEVPIYTAATLRERLSETLARPRFYTTAMAFFAGFALLLAVIGIYGVATSSIMQRTHEIGVRLALGASPRGLRTRLLGTSLMPVGIGVVAGAAAAVVLGRLTTHLIAGTEPVGFAVCLPAGLLLASVAAGAVWKAGRRIAGMDPMRVLRSE